MGPILTAAASPSTKPGRKRSGAALVVIGAVKEGAAADVTAGNLERKIYKRGVGSERPFCFPADPTAGEGDRGGAL
jgi:hypothetical protein